PVLPLAIPAVVAGTLVGILLWDKSTTPNSAIPSCRCCDRGLDLDPLNRRPSLVSPPPARIRKDLVGRFLCRGAASCMLRLGSITKSLDQTFSEIRHVKFTLVRTPH